MSDYSVGQKLYELWIASLEEHGSGSDEWDQLDERDKEVWEHLAKELVRRGWDR